MSSFPRYVGHLHTSAHTLAVSHTGSLAHSSSLKTPTHKAQCSTEATPDGGKALCPWPLRLSMLAPNLAASFRRLLHAGASNDPRRAAHVLEVLRRPESRPAVEVIVSGCASSSRIVTMLKLTTWQHRLLSGLRLHVEDWPRKVISSNLNLVTYGDMF